MLQNVNPNPEKCSLNVDNTQIFKLESGGGGRGCFPMAANLFQH